MGLGDYWNGSMIEMKCPHCGHQLRIDDKYSGQVGACKACQQKITVPIGIEKESIAKTITVPDFNPDIFHEAPSHNLSKDISQNPEIVYEKKDNSCGKSCGISCLVIFTLFFGLAILGTLFPDVPLESAYENSSIEDLQEVNNGSNIIQQPESDRWFSGGNLHDSTIGQWREASFENKLATVSDWLAGTKWKGHLNSYEDFEILKIKSEILVNAIDDSVDNGILEDAKTMEIAASIITLSNDLGPNDGVTKKPPITKNYVYVVQGRDIYHKKTCHLLKRATKQIEKGSTDDAKQYGYRACKVCNPR